MQERSISFARVSNLWGWVPMHRYAFRTFACVTTALIGMGPVQAATPGLPGPADAGRVQQDRETIAPAPIAPGVVPPPQSGPVTEAPAGAEQVTFILKGLIIDGATVYSPESLAAPYQERIGQQVTLKEIYAIADAIGAKYHDAGYFLSRVEVPDQQITKGFVHITVTEGYIGRVDVRGDTKPDAIMRAYMARITAEKPLSTQTLESALLRLNDLPGVSFRAVLSAMPDGEKGESLLTLLPQAKSATGSIGIDNYGSRFLGPQEITASASGSIAPLNQTTVSGLVSMPTKELGFGTLHHTVTVAPDVTVSAEVGVTRAHPGYTLSSLDIDSTATDVNVSIQYQWVRQRLENLATSLMLEGRNVHSDVLDTPLTREHIRVARAHVAYDTADAGKGSDVANLTLSQGIDGLGSSDAGDPDLSRAEAKPDFTKLELSLSRLQTIDPDWSALMQFDGQWASGSLYASEQFGYGGQNFGRAFDSSEITGDKGGEAALELRYDGWRDLQPVNLEPYAFYDYGFVINDDSSQLRRDSAQSVGAGVRFVTTWGDNGNVGVALPIDHTELAPLYGGNHSSPRLLMQFSHNF